MGRLPRDAREELEVTKVYDPYFGTTTSATHIVAPEIDPETCKVELNRYVVAEDSGHMINPMIVDGQACGGRNRAGGADAFEQLGLAGADTRPGLKDDANPHRRHIGTVPRAPAVFEARHPCDFAQGAARPRKHKM
jgi:hypothetical protein